MQTEHKLGRNPLRKLGQRPKVEKSMMGPAFEKLREMQIQVHWPELFQSTLDTRIGVQLTKFTRFFSRS